MGSKVARPSGADRIEERIIMSNHETPSYILAFEARKRQLLEERKNQKAPKQETKDSQKEGK
jgi:hypothetical protein